MNLTVLTATSETKCLEVFSDHLFQNRGGELCAHDSGERRRRLSPRYLRRETHEGEVYQLPLKHRIYDAPVFAPLCQLYERERRRTLSGGNLKLEREQSHERECPWNEDELKLLYMAFRNAETRIPGIKLPHQPYPLGRMTTIVIKKLVRTRKFVNFFRFET
jgi:hypothetical protein